MTTITAVVFDIGETLTSDTRYWADWARWLDVPQHTMSALVGHVLARGLDNAEAIRLIRPDIDVAAEWAARRDAGQGDHLAESDLYPDVRPALQQLRDAGVWVGIAGNQNREVTGLLRGLDLPADAIATSGEWGISKPSAGFFTRVAEWAPGDQQQILYVGDHPANDIAPARAAGLRTAHLRRGPIGLTTSAPDADWTADSLTDLADLVVRQLR
ncbi:HAD family hydrolase [Kitasatospora cineracea]|uniref:HAD superfamily hydrolase (TIGR01549 family) n=1 Tax=Kitasatospora cineracea TaxID=88074 RepID=A0A3N4RV12_9ACTN|nr:HAD family hydrolase [Kitasatospora cineracea]RPE34899.1 HAD superfamily hydrolase (TIGR01549 family) [Kitasatospora cineracea]